MKNTGYDLHGPIIEKRATGYERTATGYRNAPYLDMSIPYAAGSMYSTVEDLYLWDQALYTDRVVAAQSKALMFKPSLGDYAYGWVINKAEFGNGGAGVPRIMHGGGINGFNTLLIRYPEQRHVIVLLDNTSQGESLDRLHDTIERILFNQPHTLPKQSIAQTLFPIITDQGLEAGLAQYRELKARQFDVYDFSEPELNRLGYQLLQGGKQKEAIEIFKLNVAEYPKAFNTYDSLGEAYMVSGDLDLAILNYKKSLELNAQNNNAVAMLKRIETKPVAVDARTFDAYVGEYEVTPSFKVAVFKEGEKLMTQATNQPAFEIFPEGDNKFFLRAVEAKVTFTRDAQGAVTGLVIHQGGRDIPGKKIK
jgi:tetratricopeptide (TPR) repeat protein